MMIRMVGLAAVCLMVSGVVGVSFADGRQENTMDKVQRYINEGDSANAEKLMRKALKANPGDWKMWNDLGNLLFAGGDFKKAREAYNKALEADAMQAMTYSNLGALALAQNDAEAAFRNLITATELDSEYVPAQYNLGMYYTRSQKLTSAQEIFSRALKLDPEHAGALFAMARIKRMTGEPQESLAYYQRGLNSDPDYIEGRIEYGMLQFALKNNSAAEDILRDCIRRYPKSADAYYALGLFLRDTGRLDEAARSMNQAVDMDGSTSRMLIDYGLILLYKTGRKDAGPGEEQIKKALKLAPKDGHTVYMSAIFYDDAGMLKDAVKLYKKAATLDYKPQQAKVYYAEALIKLGDKKAGAKVIAELEKELDPDDPLRKQLAGLKGGLE